MANYIATARTNYFRVKNSAEFTEWCDLVGVASMCKDDPDDPENPIKKLFGFTSECDDSGCFPTWTSEDEEIDYVNDLGNMLKKGEVAILMEAGAEKYRYVSGWAQAISWKCEEVSISLGNIYDKALKKFKGCGEISLAEY